MSRTHHVEIPLLIDRLRALVELLADDQTRPPNRRTQQLLADWAALGYPDHTPGHDPTSPPPPPPDHDQADDEHDEDRGRRSLVSDPTANAVTHHDEWQHHLEQLPALLAWLDDNATDTIRIVKLVHTVDDRDEPHRKTGAGYCQACARWVPGTSDDRIRSGYCDACRKAWERAGYPDRVAFEHRRQAAAENDRRTRVAAGSVPTRSSRSPGK